MAGSLKVILIVMFMVLPSLEAILERSILKFLEDWRLRMCHPLNSLGLPPMDPFHIKNVAFSMRDEELYNISGSLLDFNVVGFSNFQMEDLLIVPLPLMKSHLRVFVPYLNISASYIANGSMFSMVNIDSESDADINIHQLALELTWIFKVSPKLSIYLLNTTFSINDIKVGIDHLFNEPKLNEFVEYVINELGLEFIKGWQSKTATINHLVESSLNVFMNTLTIHDVFQIISAYAANNTTGMIFDDIPKNCKRFI